MAMRLSPLALLLTLAACGEPQESIRPLPVVAVEQPKIPGAAVSNRLGIAVRPAERGVTVVAIELDGPAGEAGLQVGDRILKVNGEPVSSETELVRLAEAAGGARATLEFVRGKDARQVAVRFGEGNMPNPLGLKLRELPKSALKVLGLPYGLLVMRVDPPADRSRLQPGDIIVGVNRSQIASLEEFNRLVSSSAAAVALLVRRGSSDLYIPVETGASAPRAPRGPAPGRPATDTPLRT
jgi:S1-C subfamily serine protease